MLMLVGEMVLSPPPPRPGEKTPGGGGGGGGGTNIILLRQIIINACFYTCTCHVCLYEGYVIIYTCVHVEWKRECFHA